MWKNRYPWWWDCKNGTDIVPQKIFLKIKVKKLKIELPYDAAILFLGIYPKVLKTKSQRDTCAPMFPVAFFTIAEM